MAVHANDNGDHQATLPIRNQWLLASRGYFRGCVPHAMEDACATQPGQFVFVLPLIGCLELKSVRKKRGQTP